MPKASVKIMRSYDYCHFEICLGSDEEMTLDQIDAMRKEANRLVDKAVEQYKVQKQVLEFNSQYYKFERLNKIVEDIRKKSESEWTETEKANVKRFEDLCHVMNKKYDYEDDYDDAYLDDAFDPVNDEPINDQDIEL
jgi:hypothetical protein